MSLKKKIAVKLLFFIFVLSISTNALLVSWTGSQDNLWNNNNNWSNNAVPTVIDTVVFSSGAINCTISGSATMYSLKITSGYTGNFTIDGATISVAGSASLEGAIGDSLILTPTTTANLQVTGLLYANYAVLGNINSTAYTQGKAFNSRDAAANTNWIFLPVGSKIWSGGGIDQNWSTVENWMPKGIPTASDSVIFDGTSNKNCIVDVTATVKDLSLESIFTGSFSLASSTINIDKNCKIANYSTGFTTSDLGTFNFSGSAAQIFEPLTTVDNPNITTSNTSILTINTTANATIKSLNIGAGTSVTAPSTFELIIKDDFINSGTFNHNNGTIKFDTLGGTHNINIGASTFYNLYFIGNGTYQPSTDLKVDNTMTLSGVTLDLGTGLNHNIKNIITLAYTATLNFNGSTLNTTGNVDLSLLSNLQFTTSALIDFTGTSAQIFTPFGINNHPSLRITNGTGVSFGNLLYNVVIRSLEIIAGGNLTAPSPSYSLVIKDSFSNNGTFNHNNGSVAFDSTSGTHTINSVSPFYRMNIIGSGATYQFASNLTISRLELQNGNLDMGSSFTHTLDTLTSITGSSSLNFNSSRVVISKEAYLSSITNITAGTDTIEFNETSNISLAATGTLGNILHSGTGTLSISNNLAANSFTQTNGSLSLASSDLTISGDFNIKKGYLNNFDGRTITVSGNANIKGAIADSVYLTPAAVTIFSVTGALNAEYAVLQNVNASISAGVAVNSRDATGNTNWSFSTLTPTITTTAISTITSASASSGGNITSDGGDPVTAKGVCWSTKTNPTTANSKSSDGTGTGTFVSSITALSASTTYYVRAYATNGIGTVYGNEISFTTTAIVDVITETPILKTPASNDTIHNFPTIDFTLPEAALTGSVKMTFMQTGGTSDFNSPHEIKFKPGFEAAGNHTTILNSKDLSNNTEVDTVSSGTNDFLEHGGIYSVKIGYQDATGNALSEVIASNVMFTDTVVFNVGPMIISGNYYELNNELHLTFDKKIFSVDSTKNFYLSTDNGVSDTMIVQAPWSWSYFDATKTTVKINVPTADISLLEGLPNKTQLEIALQDSTFKDSLSWMDSVDYSMNKPVGYVYNTTPLNISSAGYDAVSDILMLVFNDTITFVDTMAQLGIYNKNDTSQTFTFTAPWAYTLNTSKDTITVMVPTAEAIYIESWTNVDSSLSLLSGQDAFASGSKKTNIHDKSSIYPVGYKSNNYLYNMFGFSLTNMGDTAIAPYLYFINTTHDSGKGVLVSYGLGHTILDTTQNAWAFKDTSFFIPNTLTPGYWFFTWAPVGFDGTVGEIKTDSIEIKNLAPVISANAKYSIYEDSLFTISSLATDKNSNPITLFINNAPAGMILNQTNLSISWTPTNDNVGENKFTLKAVDSLNASDSLVVLISVINTNDLPIYDTVNIPDTLYEDIVYNGEIKAHDIDKNDLVTLSIDSDTSWVKIIKSGSNTVANYKFDISLFPKDAQSGINILKFRVTDSFGGETAFLDTVFVVNTNDAPKLKLQAKASNLGAATYTYKGTDDFDTVLTYISTLKSASYSKIDTNKTGILSYFPLGDGTYYLTCSVFDKDGLSSSLSDTFTIVGVTSKTFVKDSNWNLMSIPATNYSAQNFKSSGTILHWDETKHASTFYKYYTRENAIISLTAGKSYFVRNSDSIVTISLNPDSLINTNFNIILNSGEYGWNQISSPYSYPVKVNNTGITLWEYDPSTKDYIDAQGVMMPWKGYWAQVDATQTLALTPTPFYKGTRSRRSISRHTSSDEWIYTIKLTSSVSQDRDNYFGFSPEATDGRDRFDRPEAPRMNDVPNLFFSKPDWNSSINRFASDVRKNRSREEMFNIGISGSSVAQEEMKINISGYTKNSDVYLFTRTQDGIKPYEPGSTVIINSSENDQYITVIASKTPTLSIPLSFKTFSPYPNPCRPVSNIRYTLPYRWQSNGALITADYRVRILIYDVRGRVIKEIVNDLKKPGTHKAVWRGNNTGGTQVASGAYFVRIMAGEFVAVKKVVMLK